MSSTFTLQPKRPPGFRLGMPNRAKCHHPSVFRPSSPLMPELGSILHLLFLAQLHALSLSQGCFPAWLPSRSHHPRLWLCTDGTPSCIMACRNKRGSRVHPTSFEYPSLLRSNFQRKISLLKWRVIAGGLIDSILS